MTEINYAAIESKWQEKWDKKKAFTAKDNSKKENYYVLEMFAYPSGTGLHMGHAWNFTLGDILARFKRLQGFNVLHPTGYDSLGLPAENAAIKAGTHPEEYTLRAMENFGHQQRALGITYDWDRLLATSDPEYYKWDQWIFLEMYKKGLAYQKTSSVNWCPECDTVLANEQVQNGVCWRHENTKIEIKNLKQWFLKITDYAEELYENIDELKEWPEKTKTMQKNWIGKSHGYEILFSVQKANGEKEQWPIFTTRPDTIFGVTFMVIAANHPQLPTLITKEQEQEVNNFLKKVQSVSEKDFNDLEKEGAFTGSYAINPANNEKIPIYTGNFVLAEYGSGMVMAVPAHDQRDHEFAKKYDIPIKQVIAQSFLDEQNPPRKEAENTQREIIHAIVLNKEKNKFIALKHKQQEWLTPITGGVEEGEDITQAAIREIQEETGYQNLKLERTMPYKLHAQFYAAHKKVNRSVQSNILVFSLENEEQQPLSEEEAEKHEVTWLDIKKLNTLHPVSELEEIVTWFNNKKEKAYTEEGVLVHSKEFSGLWNTDAIEKIGLWLAEQNLAKKTIHYRLRDWGISRQRYWGTPIPIIHCNTCGTVPVPEFDLPITLPKNVDFGKGNPLETNNEWLNTPCPKCGEQAKRESDTMDTFVNSSWYYLRFCDPQNNKIIFEKKKANNYCPIDTYIGGAEHACMHLIYARFYTKFLRDLGILNFDEPATRLFHQGFIHAEDGHKMSKSKGNVIEPLEIIKKYGADTLRFFMVSMASPDKDWDWNEKGLNASSKFIKKIFSFNDDYTEKKDSKELINKLHQTIKDISEYYNTFEYRKATITLRELFNEIEKEGCSKKTFCTFLQLLNPICPHITEELWNKQGNKELISTSQWPTFDKKKIIKEKEKTDINEKIIETTKKLLKKTGGVPNKIYAYIMPFEYEQINQGAIQSNFEATIEIFSTDDNNKVDPQQKAKKAKPGKPSIYFEE